MSSSLMHSLQMSWIAAKSWAHARWGTVPSRNVRAYKIYGFNCTDDLDGFHDVYSTKLYPDVALVRDAIRWDAYDIEIRYTFRGHKYRVIFRDDDDLTFPLPREMGLVLAPKLVTAYLVRRDDETFHHDVTERVRKYMGPDRDFHAKHGAYVHVHDMFPFDDNDDNSERFSSLRMVLSTGKILEFDYASNPVVTVG